MKYCIILFFTFSFFISCTNIFENLFGTHDNVTFLFDNTKQSNGSSYIVYLDANNNKKILFMANNQSNVTIGLNKNYLTPILLYSSSYDTEPSGCIYPYNTTLDTYGGFAAWILYRLQYATNENVQKTHTYLSYFNWQRFIDYIKKYDNPWVLHQDLILENIADRTFNVYSIKEK